MSGGGSLGYSQNKSGSNSSFDQDVWGTQGDALNSLYSQIGSLFGQTNQGMQSQIPSSVNWMNQVQDDSLNPWRQQMEGGAYADMGLQDSLMASLNESMGKPSAMSEINAMTMGGEGNNYADAMKESYINDASKAQNMMLANTDRRAVGSGMSGSSRHGMAQGMGSEAITDQLQNNLNQTGYETFEKDLDRKLEIAGQADQANLSRQQMMQDMLGSQQNAMSGGLNYGSDMQNLGMGSFSPYMAPWQAAGAYTDSIGAPTVLGSGSSRSSSKGGGGSAAGYGGKGGG